MQLQVPKPEDIDPEESQMKGNPIHIQDVFGSRGAQIGAADTRQAGREDKRH